MNSMVKTSIRSIPVSFSQTAVMSLWNTGTALKVLIPMQMEIDGTAEIDEAEKEIINEMEM